MNYSSLKTHTLALMIVTLIGCFSLITTYASEPKFGGTLRVMSQTDISSLDPHKLGWQNHEIARQIFEGLLAVDEGLKVIPGLAESWKISENGLVYTFKLHHGIKFHNGKEMTSADVKATFERVKQSAIGSQFASVESIDTPDAYTVVMKLSAPTATLLISVASPYTVGIMPAEEAMSEENKKNIQHPIGTGLYEFVEWIPDRYIKLKRFEKYWGGAGQSTGTGGKKTAYVDEVVIRPIKESAVQAASLEAGDVDLGFVHVSQKDRLEKNPQVKIASTGPTLSFWNFWFGTKPGSPMNDINLRKAFAYAINKKEMLVAATGGPGVTVNAAFPSFTPWYTKHYSTEYGPQQDIEKAKAYLKKSRYNGETLMITTCKNYAPMYKQAVVAQAQLKSVGINTELELMDWTSLFAKYKSGKFDIVSYGYGAHADPDAYFYARLHSSNTYNGWGNAEFDKIVLAARSTNDFEKRKAAYDQAQKILVDELPLLPTFSEEFFYGYNKRVHGLKPWGTSLTRLWNIWLDK
ncbi:hypothetical protein KKI24_07275 [bacterium]|nr:hypothetical protein [bacterium]